MTSPSGPRFDSRLGNPEWVDNWTVGAGLRMEFIDSNGQVWLCHEPVTQERARALSLPDGTSLSLLGGLVADAAYFSRSPLADADGPLDTTEVDGLRFSFVARPLANERIAGASAERSDSEAPHAAELKRPTGRDRRRSAGPPGTTVMSIDKDHTMLHASGHSIDVLDFGDGTLALPAWSAPNALNRSEVDRSELDLPDQWSLRTVKLTHDLIAVIPNPAKVAILKDGSGFHGPLPISQLESACR